MINAADVAPAVVNTTVQQAIVRAIAIQTRLGNAQRQRRTTLTLQQAEIAVHVKPADVRVIANKIVENAKPGRLDEVDDKFAEYGARNLSERLKPRSLMHDLNHVAANHGLGEVEELLSDRLAAVRGYNYKGSWRIVQSGIRLWVAFATQFLDYNMACVLPPLCSEHVQKYVATMFSNPGTAYNYVCYLRIGCSEMGDDKMLWDDHGVQVALKGVKKINLEKWGRPARIAWLMTYTWVMSLFTFNKFAGRLRLALAHMFNYELLLRTE